jgi:hypothetical protein
VRAESLKAVGKVVEAFRSSKKNQSGAGEPQSGCSIQRERHQQRYHRWDVIVDYGKLPEISIKKEDSSANAAAKTDSK